MSGHKKGPYYEHLHDVIGDNLRLARERAGVTQEQLAQAIGNRTKGSVSEVERGLRVPKTEFVLAVCDVLGVSPAVLMGWSAEPKTAGWRAFLETGEAKVLAPDERQLLAAIPFPPSWDPPADLYLALARTLRFWRDVAEGAPEPPRGASEVRAKTGAEKEVDRKSARG